MGHPAGNTRSRGPGHQSVLQGPVKAFDHTVALWVVGRGEVVFDAQEGGQFLPQTRGKLPATIRNDGRGNAEARNPMPQKSEGAGLGRDRRQRDRLHPPGETVDHSEEITVAFRLGERPHKIQMDDGETGVGHLQGH